ncbi:MAG: hypothetical protein Q4C42_05300 [Clostridia bacterium]|nr:hypothetical protein [Clostridia bacterium]
MEKNISSSLINRNVYYACDIAAEGMRNFRGDLAMLRREFFANGMRTASAKYHVNELGNTGKLSGKISRHKIRWTKTLGKIRTEEAFQTGKNFTIVRRDLNNRIIGKITYNNEMKWLKTEYFSPSDFSKAVEILKPCETDDAIEKYIYNEEKNRYNITELYPSPYETDSAEQSLVNSEFDSDFVLVSTDEGDFCYTSAEEAEKRKEASAAEKTGDMNGTWDEEAEAPETGAAVSEEEPEFTSMEEIAELKNENCEEAADDTEIITDEPLETEDNPEETEEITEELSTNEKDDVENTGAQEELSPAESDVVENTDGEEAAVNEPEDDQQTADEQETEETPTDTEETAEEIQPEETEPAETEPVIIEDNAEEPEAEADAEPEAEEENTEAESAEEEDDTALDLAVGDGKHIYSGRMRNGKREGKGRTETADGIPVYIGDYADDRRNGIGTSYFRDGALSYAGNWKNDKKDGLGVSFNPTDNSIHVTRWENGSQASESVSIDSEGRLLYYGNTENGKKHGTGISVRKEDGRIYVGDFEGGKAAGMGSLFDADGRLVYTGHFADGVREGFGTEFDKEGRVVYSGEWKNDEYSGGILYKKI